MKEKKNKQNLFNEDKQIDSLNSPEGDKLAREIKSSKKPGFLFSKAGFDWDATYGTRNYDPMLIESQETPSPGAYN